MLRSGRLLTACVSIPAIASIKKLEPSSRIPSPKRRIRFLHQLHGLNIATVLTLRPLFPQSFIPIDELIDIIVSAASASSAVLSSGIVLEEGVQSRLRKLPADLHTVRAPLMPCLGNKYDVLYVDVEPELRTLRDVCSKRGLPFFTESISAVLHIHQTASMSKPVLEPNATAEHASGSAEKVWSGPRI